MTLILFSRYKDDTKKTIIRDLQQRAQITPKTANAKFDRSAFERMRAMLGNPIKKGGE